MSTANSSPNTCTAKTLTSLLDYLYGTLSPDNLRWMGEHLIEYANKEENEQLRPYTMQEVDEMLDEAEAAFEAGDFLTNDEVFHREGITFNTYSWASDCNVLPPRPAHCHTR